MGYISEEVIEASLRLGYTIQKMPSNDAAIFRSRLLAQYKFDPLSLKVTDDKNVEIERIHSSESWSWLSQFLENLPVLFFFRQEDDPDILEIPSGAMIVPLLRETTGWLFYLASQDNTFIVCFDDHDCLIGSGTAAEWIRQIKRQVK